jgi:DNA-binding NtrC family response regulator
MQHKIAFVSDRLVEFHSFLKSAQSGEYRLDLFEHLEAIKKFIQNVYYDLFIIDINEEWYAIPFWLLEQARHRYLFQVIIISNFSLPSRLKNILGERLFRVLDLKAARETLPDVVQEARKALEDHRFNPQPAWASDVWVQDGLVGESEAIRRANEFIKLISKASFTPCLIRGETGTGKTFASHLIHANKEQNQGAFIVKNCENSTTNEMLSDLFGVEGESAIYGPPRKGLIEQAANGTLVLKNIERLPLEVQHHLLLYLDGHVFKPLGAETPIQVNTRIIAQTRYDLDAFVRNGTFNPELYYHLKSFEIYLPPLRERRGDVELLVKYFMQYFSFLYAKKINKISPMAMNILKDYYWPGNINELKELLERSVLLSESNEIGIKHLPPYLNNASGISEDIELLGNCSLKEIERVHIERVLARTNGNKSRAADILQISRTTLREKIKSYGIDT